MAKWIIPGLTWDEFKKWAAPFIKTTTGIDFQDVDGTQMDDINLMAVLKDLRNDLYNGYQTFVADTSYVIPALQSFSSKELKSTKAVEIMLNELTNRQSKFSKWMLNYAPFSTAVAKVEAKARELDEKIKEQNQKMSEILDENRMIENANQKGREAVEKANMEAQAAADQANRMIEQKNAEAQRKIQAHNEDIDRQIRDMDLMIDDLNELRNAGEGTRASSRWHERHAKLGEKAAELLRARQGETGGNTQ